MEFYSSSLSSPPPFSGAEGEVEPATGWHIPWRGCMCQIYL